ncbi:hypothetical protein, partial [Klebsiella pneumoniae]|uniref:hypothetical protein n=2 Tax=Klebsiella TaxID=570 RepID=UPI00272F0756
PEGIPATAGIVNLRYKSCPEMAGQDQVNMMKNLIIKITAIDAGDDSLPCHLFPTETCDAVSFNTSPGLDTDTVRAVIYSLFEDACNVDYSPVDGSGAFTAIDSPPTLEAIHIH